VDELYLKAILDTYKDKQFVQRILEPDKYPKFDLGNNEYATHLMSYAKVGDRFIVYPEVVFDKKKNKLLKLGRKKALEYAISNSEYIPFLDSKEAEWFSKNYKQIWNK